MKRILILILVFVLVISTPYAVFASETSTTNEYNVDVIYDDSYDAALCSIDYTQIYKLSLPLGQDFSANLSNVPGSILQPYFNLTQYLEPYKLILKDAKNIYMSAFINGVFDSGGIPNSGSILPNYVLDDILSGSIMEISFNDGFLNGDVGFYSIDVTSALSGNWSEFSIFFDFYTRFKSIQDASPLIMVRTFSIIFYIESDSNVGYEQFLVITNDLKNIDNSVKQVANEVKVMQGKLDNIQSDINSGFNEVGGKLDSMLTPDSNNQQAVDQMGGQVDSNKQEAEDIKNQIDSLDKPDPDDLIDQIDPDQFIDNDDEAVQEMTGILASVTGSKVVKNYLLILICIGIVSFVVYGKKGG